MQGFGTPVSATGQGEKAGPQSSSSSDRSFTLVGNLASVEYNVTRNNSHECDKSPDTFCFVCGEFEVSKYRRPLSDKLKSLYRDCFSIEITNQDVNWAPHIVCGACYMMLMRWGKTGKSERLRFTKPMVWSAPSCRENCYFCMTNIIGFTSTTKANISYANVSSVVKPEKIAVVDKTMVTEPMDVDHSCEKEEMQVDELSEEESENDNEDDKYLPAAEKNAPQTFSQEELNDLIRDLGLPKDGAEYLAAALRKKNLLSKGTTAYVYRDREKEFRKFFTKDEENSLVFCSDVKGLVDELKSNTYKDEEWRLFIDSSKRSLKAVLLHNGNTYAPIPIAHSTKLKETYENLQIVLEKIKYSEHQWKVCGDLKISTLILGQQSGFTKNPCFLCLWDSRDRKNHYVQKEWPKRTEFHPGSRNIIRRPLIDPSKILLPPLHIKLGLMKQFVKALDKNGDCFQYLGEKFPAVSDAKLKEGIFDGPQIRTLFRDENFITQMNDTEKAAWQSFKNISQNFLGNEKSEDYQNLVEELLENFKQLGCLMSLKLHFLHSHLDYFPQNLGDYNSIKI